MITLVSVLPNLMIKNELKFLLKHTSIYGIGTVVGQAVGFILLPVYTRYLTPADYGVMALVNATMGIIGIVVGLGMNNAISRFYYEFDNDGKRKLVVSTIYFIGLGMGILMAPVFYVLSGYLSIVVFKSTAYQKLFLVSSIALLFGIITNICMEYLRVIAASTKYVSISLIRMVVVISFNIFFIVFEKTGVIGIFYSSLISGIIFSSLLSFYLLSKIGLNFSLSLSIEMIKYSFPLIFSNIFRVIVNESDKYFVNYFFSPAETGIFSLAQKIASSIHTLVTSPFIQTYIPRRFEIMKREDAKETYASISIYYLLVVSSIGLALAVFSHEIITVMTTTQYYASSKFIPFMILSLIIFGMKYHFQIGIMIEKKTKIIAYINAISCFINIALNWLLIRHWGIWGAILSVNIAYATITVLDYVFSQKMYPIKYDFKMMSKLLTVVGIVYYISTLLNQTNLLLGIFLKSGLLFMYMISLILLGIVKRSQIRKGMALVLCK